MGFKSQTFLSLSLPPVEGGWSSLLSGVAVMGIGYKAAVTVTDEPEPSVIWRQGLCSGQIRGAVSSV